MDQEVRITVTFLDITFVNPGEVIWKKGGNSLLWISSKKFDNITKEFSFSTQASAELPKSNLQRMIGNTWFEYRGKILKHEVIKIEEEKEIYKSNEQGRVVVILKGGTVQAIHTDREMAVYIVDYDMEGMSEEEESEHIKSFTKPYSPDSIGQVDEVLKDLPRKV